MSEKNNQDFQNFNSKAISDDELDQVSGGIAAPMICIGCKAKVLYPDANGNYSCTCGWHN